MNTPIHARAIALALAAAALAPPLHAQQRAADDPQAAVPTTRYQPAHVHPEQPADDSTPDRNWQALNRAVGASAAATDPHAGHARHAPPAKQEQAEAAPHHHHHHEGHHP